MFPLDVLLQIVPSGGRELTVAAGEGDATVLVSDVKHEVVFGGALVVALLAPVPHALVLGLHVNLEGALGLGLVAAVRTRPQDPLVYCPDVVLEVDPRGPAVVALIAEKARRAVDRLHVLLEVVPPG